MSTMTGEVRVGDIGTVWSGKLLDAGAAFDPTSASTTTIIFRSPGQAVRLRSATVVALDGNWYLTYTSLAVVDAALLDEPGLYHWQGFVAFADGQQYHTTIDTFIVGANLN